MQDCRKLSESDVIILLINDCFYVILWGNAVIVYPLACLWGLSLGSVIRLQFCLFRVLYNITDAGTDKQINRMAAHTPSNYISISRSSHSLAKNSSSNLFVLLCPCAQFSKYRHGVSTKAAPPVISSVKARCVEGWTIAFPHYELELDIIINYGCLHHHKTLNELNEKTE